MENESLHELISLLSKPAAERRQADLQAISEATKNVKFFQSQSQEIHMACCKVMKVQRFEGQSVVFNKGDPGDSFCVILQGSVNVLIPETGPKNSDVASMKLVTVMSEGQAFGELSLLQNRDRAATIQCREATHLAVLSKSDFNRILRINESRRLHEKIHFFQSLAAFAEWNEAALSRFVYYFHEERCHRGAVVFRQGDPSMKVYIVISGEFLVSEGSEVKLDDTHKSKRSSLHREIQLLVKGSKEMFGEEEVLTGHPRQSTCTCLSYEGSLYSVARDDFLKFCQRDSTLRYLNKYEKAKKMWMDVRRPAALQAENAKMRLSLRCSVTTAGSFHEQPSQDLFNLRKDLMLHRTVKASPRKLLLHRLSDRVPPLSSDRSAPIITPRMDIPRTALNPLPLTSRHHAKDVIMRRQLRSLVNQRSMN